MVGLEDLLVIGEFFENFLYLFLRMVFFIGFMPVFSASKNIKLKIGIASTITVLLMGVIPPGVLPEEEYQIIWFTLTEALIGLGMAMVLKIAFAITEVAGHAMSQAGGLSFATTADPQNGTSIPVIGNFLSLIAMLLFLSLNGVGHSIEALSMSYLQLPPGNLPGSNVIQSIYEYSSIIFRSAFLIALPIVTAVTMANLAFGIMTRTAPQINILAIGLPISLSITLIMVSVGMDGFVYYMTDIFDQTIVFMRVMYE
jgi:flagellar biosynthetic protein FliR